MATIHFLLVVSCKEKKKIAEKYSLYKFRNHIGGVMVSVLASSAVDGWIELRLGQTKE